MPTDQLIEKIRGFIVAQFPTARGRSLGADERLLQNGVLDSMGVLNLVGYLEEEFSIEVADEDLVPENFETLHRLGAFVEGKRSAVSGGSA